MVIMKQKSKIFLVISLVWVLTSGLDISANEHQQIDSELRLNRLLRATAVPSESKSDDSSSKQINEKNDGKSEETTSDSLDTSPEKDTSQKEDSVKETVSEEDKSVIKSSDTVKSNLMILFYGTANSILNPTLKDDSFFSKTSRIEGFITDDLYPDEGSIGGSGTPGSGDYIPPLNTADYFIKVDMVNESDSTKPVKVKSTVHEYPEFHPEPYDPESTFMPYHIDIKNSDLTVGVNTLHATVYKKNGSISDEAVEVIKVKIEIPTLNLPDIPYTETNDNPTIDVSSSSFMVNYGVSSKYAKNLKTTYVDTHNGKVDSGDVGDFDNSTNPGSEHADKFTLTGLSDGKHQVDITTTDDQLNKVTKKFTLQVKKPTSSFNIVNISDLNYGNAIKIPAKTTLFNPVNKLNIQLSAVNVGHWQLNVKSAGFTDDPNAFVFKSQADGVEQPIDNINGITVLSGDGVADDKNQTFDAEGTGVLLKARPSKIRAQAYSAKLEWTLSTVPVK